MSFGNTDRADVLLHFTDSGARKANAIGTPLLLVHGWGCDGADWAAVRRAFDGRRRVIVPDLRGHGRSSAPPTGYSPRHLAGDLAALLRLLRTGPVVAVGHSMGGHVVCALAVEHPELVRAVVTVATGFGGDAQAADRLPAEQAALRSEGTCWAVRYVRRAFGPRTPPEVRARHERLMAAMDPAVLARCRYGMYLAPDAFGLRLAAERYLRGRRCPSLAVHTSPAAADWERTLPSHPRSRVELWADSGHFVPEEQPAKLVASLEEWIGELEATEPLRSLRRRSGGTADDAPVPLEPVPGRWGEGPAGAGSDAEPAGAGDAG